MSGACRSPWSDLGLGLGLVWFGWVRGEGDVLLVFFFFVDVVGEYSRGFES